MISGILNIYKEKGYTSHDVVARLRGIVGQKKIGHTGTLDPEAEGVLPVCLGRATKVCDMLTDKDKTYETVLLLGTSTDTQDITGRVLVTHSLDDPELPDGAVTEEKTESCIRSFIGEYDQIPPMYSALKVGGKKLYEIVRAGGEVERKARTVNITRLGCSGPLADGDFVLDVECSKGTYIRSLCADIGEALGCGACMSALRRTYSGPFSAGEAYSLEEIERSGVESFLLPVDMLFSDRPALTLTSERDEKAVRNGNELRAPEGAPEGEVRVYASDGEFLMLGAVENGALRTIKSFFEV